MTRQFDEYLTATTLYDVLYSVNNAGWNLSQNSCTPLGRNDSLLVIRKAVKKLFNVSILLGYMQ